MNLQRKQRNSGAFDWGNISSNVSIGIAIISPGMPSLGFYSVIGKVYTDGTLGETVPYDSNGNITTLTGNFGKVTIYMNTNSNAFSGASNPTTAATKTFIHEVGHALKLAHPLNDSSVSNHIYGGLPCAVMNQGYPNSTSVASTVASHDIDNLKAKWGN